MPLESETIKQYKILNMIGKGGMGEVYIAQDTVLDRKVAIKILPEEFERDAQSRMRFLREAKAAAALDHPFICKVYETGEYDDKAYIVMEFIEGEPLNERLEKEPLHMREALHITLEIAEALEKAHSHQIIHRDLKPANIMLTPQGHVKVMDFGLAKWVEPSGGDDLAQTVQDVTQQMTLTEEGAIAGTLAYMSPEQARGKPLDARSDIFSLGLIFYEMATGRHPFIKTSGIETLSAILRDPTPHPQIRPKSHNPLLSPIFRKALSKDVENRYPSIKNFIHDLKKTQRDRIGGSRFLQKGLPIILGAIIVTAVLTFLVLKFTRKPQVAAAESSPEPVSILIADVDNKTGDVVFDGVLEKVLSLSLDGTSYVSVFDSKQARQQAIELKPGSEGEIDLEVAQLISRRQGINAVVDASIEETDGGYLIKASAWDPAKAEQIAEIEQTIKEKSDVLKVADVLAAKLSAELGVIPDDSTESLIKETFTTTSIEAMSAYAQGQELDDLGRPDEAIQSLLKALDYDPNFGRAYTTLGVIYYNRGQYDEAKQYFQEGIKRIDQMTTREKYRARGPYYLMTRNFKKAIEEYSALAEQFPGDYSAHANLALAYFFARNMPKAVEEGLIDIEQNPQSINGRYNLSWYALGAGDFQTVEEQTRIVLERRPDFAEAYVTQALAHLGQGRGAQAAESYNKLEAVDTFGASVAATGLADIAVYEGRLKDAAGILQNGITFDLENEWSYNAAEKYLMLANIQLTQGNNTQAAQTAAKALDTHSHEAILYGAAEVYLKVGQTDKARELAGQLNKKLEPEPQVYAKLIGGQMSIARGDAQNAIILFQEAQETLDTWLGRFLLGCAYLEAEAYTEAYSEFELCLKRKGEATSVYVNDLPSYRYFPPVYYYMGRSQEGLGSDAATNSYQEFLNIKANADPGSPLVEDAHRRSQNN